VLGAALLAVAGCRGDGDGVSDESTAGPTTARKDVASRPQAAASHILVAYRGSKDCPPGVTRTRDEARDRARQIAVMLRTDRGQFGPLARKYSDDPSVQRNEGYIGNFWQGEMDPLFEQTVFALQVGEIGGPIETEYGFHVVRRDPVQRVRAHHILVAWRGAAKAPATVTRTREEARRIAEALRSKITGGEADRCQAALRFSDDPHSRLDCGDLGWLEPGLLARNIDAVVFDLAPGDVSPVIESDYGFHIFWRE